MNPGKSFRPGALSVLLSLTACAGRPQAEPGRALDLAAHERKLDAWRAHRLESLTGPDGWTTLAGLFWLESGKAYSVGSDPTSDIALPADHAPTHIGSLAVLAGGSILFTAAPNAGVTEDGKPVQALTLRSDGGG